MIAAGTLILQLRVLTLADAEHLAAQHQPRLRQADADADAAHARADQSRAALLPQLRAVAGYQRSTANYAAALGSLPASLSDTPTTNSGETFDYWSAGLWASQSLLDLPSVHRLRAARAGAEAEADAADDIALQVETEVAAIYFAARARKDLVAVARETLENKHRHLAQIEGFVAARTRPSIDLAQARTDEANAEVALLSAENEARLSRARLVLAIGIQPEGDFDVADESLPPVPGEEAPFEVQADEAARTRFDLLAADLRVEAGRLSVSAQRGNYVPTLALVTGVTEGGPALSRLAWNFSLGLSASYTIFDGLRTPALVREAEANLRGTTARRDALRLQARYELEQARLNVAAARAILAASEVALENARERVRLADGRYTAGAGSAIELADAELALAHAGAQKVQAAFSVSTARAQLLRALGRHVATTGP